MTRLFFILAVLCYATYSQQCTNTHAQSTLLSISINEASVNKIGVSTYIDVIKQAADEILPAANTGINVGVQSFGGGKHAPADTNEEFAFAQGDYTSISTTITDLPTTRDFNKHDGNKISAALVAAAAKTWTGQRYNILFTAGNPISGSGGSTTNPENYDVLCSPAIVAKQNNIQTYVALIGTQGVNYVKQFYSCVVEDVAQDIIEIDPTAPTAGIAALRSRVCKAGGIDVKITEVNPVVNAYRRYIEILNRGAPADIRACFATGYPGSCSNQANVANGAYFIGYGGASGSVPAFGTVQSSLGASAGANLWVAIAQVDGTRNDTVTADVYFQGQVTDRSFALRAVGFNNNYGANWRMTCAGTANPDFTPGLPPNDICPSNANTCINGGPDDAQCKADGSTANCDQMGGFCGCTLGWLADADTCIHAPTVSTSNCVGYMIFDPVRNKDFTYFVWELPYDGLVSYKMTYNMAGAATGVYYTLGTNAAPVLDVRPVDIQNGQSTIVVETTTTGDVSGVDSVTTTSGIVCPIGTLEPTVSPTQQPSLQPSQSPTKITSTSNPTQLSNTPTKAPVKSPTDFIFCSNSNDGSIHAGFVSVNDIDDIDEMFCEFCVCTTPGGDEASCNVIDFNAVKQYKPDLIDAFMDECGFKQDCEFKEVGLKRPSEKLTECGCNVFHCNPSVNKVNTYTFGAYLAIVITIILSM